MSISTFMGLQTALRGVLAEQSALDTTGHNIANSNTIGYSRQQAVLATTAPFQTLQGAIGTGVEVTQYNRVRDDFLDVQYRAQSMLQGYSGATQDALGQVEMNLNEPGTGGLQSQLDNFWSSFQSLSNNPEDTATRQAVVQAGSSLSDTFTSLQGQLKTISSQTQTNESLTVNDLNSTVSSIATLDQQIMSATAQNQPPSNDELDQRDVLLDKLGGMVNLGITKQTDGSVTLKVGNFTMLAAGVATPVASVASFGNDPSTGQPNLNSGSLAGMVDADTKIQAYSAQLDGIAGALITQVNAAQTSGFNLNGTSAASDPFFSGTDATTIAVAAGVAADPKLIAASDTAGQPGNSGNALVIADLSGAPAIDGAYSALITTIGSDSQDAQRASSNATAVAAAIDNKRMSVSGVSIDEEMANLLQQQRGFQASARVLTAMDDMIDTLISRTGRVGI